MSVLSRPFVFSAMLAFSAAISAMAPAHAMEPRLQELGPAIAELERFGDIHGVKITSIEVSENFEPDIVGINSTSCTVTLQATLPGGTGVTVSATAPTCSEAFNMAWTQIRDMLGSVIVP